MESRMKLLGHPVHPMLIVLPLGLFISAVVFDALYMWRNSPIFAAVGFWNMPVECWEGCLPPSLG